MPNGKVHVWDIRRDSNVPNENGDGIAAHENGNCYFYYILFVFHTWL